MSSNIDSDDDESYQNRDLLLISRNATKPSAPRKPAHLKPASPTKDEEQFSIPKEPRRRKISREIPAQTTFSEKTDIAHQLGSLHIEGAKTIVPSRHVSRSSIFGNSKRLVIAIDYGTTFTGVGIAVVPQDQKKTVLEDIKVIGDWGMHGNEFKVPSAFSYAIKDGEEHKWGTITGDATVMVHTKLELDEQECKGDELDIILHNLDGMKNLNFDHVEESGGLPKFSPKKPEQIVQDYLSKVFDRVMAYIAELGFDEEADRHKMPVDIVFTVPVNWSYRAKNSTYRAITNAGFNRKTFPGLQEIIMLTEPEAAAVYTARYLKEKKDAGAILKEDDCFIICDAGGGTVDVATFRVTQMEPTLEIEKVGRGKGAKCGSVFIDGEFKKWLREVVIGEEDYELLEPNTNGRIKAHTATSREMRYIIQQFTEYKKQFKGKGDTKETFGIELPSPFEDWECEDLVTEGYLTMTRKHMEKFFRKPLNQIVTLIAEQAEQAEVYERRVKNIFMIGGFGESKYLQAKLAAAMVERNIKIHQPDTSWTAVVRGAAMHGIEKARLKNLIRTDCSLKNYGLAFHQEQAKGADDAKHQFEDPVTGKTMGRNRMNWIIKRGDLILLSSTEAPDFLLEFTFGKEDSREFTIPIYEYLENDDDLPIRLSGAAKEMNQVLEIPISFADKDLSDFEMYMGPNDVPYYQAIVSLKVLWVDGSLNVEATWNNEPLYFRPNSPDRASSQFTSGSSVMYGSEGFGSVVTL